MRRLSLVLIVSAIFAVLALPGVGRGVAMAKGAAPLVFTDVGSQTRTFIGYYHSIALTREQESLKARALNSIPAPCCSDKPMRTCCCDCNLAKAVWGMSNYAVAKLGYSEARLRDKVLEWLAFINPGGFTGNSCYTGRCGLPFDDNGCGGMEESRLIVRAR